MKIAGHNVLAILAAALVMYAVEFVIYGVLTPPLVYMELARLRVENMPANAWKMPFGVVGPLVWAVGLSAANLWRGSRGLLAGATTGFVISLLFMIPARFYEWAYGQTGLAFYALDAAHFLIVGAIGGAVLAAWPRPRLQAA